MDCPICFDEINATTGSTTLSCSHTFHLTCIVRWYATSSSCPCCRGAPSENETIPTDTTFDKEYSKMRVSFLERTQLLLINENNRLQKIAVKSLDEDEKKWYQFSKYIERFRPSAFQLTYSDDGFGNEVILNAFIQDRIVYAEEYSRKDCYKLIYAKFLAIRIEGKRLNSPGKSYYYNPSEIIKCISIDALKMIEVYQDIIHLAANEARGKMYRVVPKLSAPPMGGHLT